MRAARSIIRPAVLGVPLFGGVPTADNRGDDTALLHLNECPYPPSPRVVEAIVAGASGVNRYAEPRPARLAAMLAERTGVPTKRIVLANGSDEILALIALVTVGPGDNAVMPAPSFPRYRLATMIQGARPIQVRTRPDGSNDVDGLLAAIEASTRVVYACSPNNPSGAPASAADLERLAMAVPENVLLVVDEAYAEFDRREGGIDALPILVRRHGPWIATRTFSKAYALAGLRIGYGLASSRAIAEALVKVKLNFNLNRLGVLAAMAALGDERHSWRCIDDAIAERDRLTAGLLALGLAPLRSRTNFVSFDIGRDARPVMEAMAAERVLVREWRDPGYESFMRISVGLPDENDRALAALGRALAAEATSLEETRR